MNEFAKVRKVITRGALAGVSLASASKAVASESAGMAIPAAEIEATHRNPFERVKWETVDDTAGTPVVVRKSFNEIWDEGKQARFLDLARKDALSSLSKDEAMEMSELQIARERSCAPRSFEEIERDYEIERCVALAIDALDNLIHRASNRR